MTQTQRTDPHRPGAIIPSDYQFVLAFGRMPVDIGAVVVQASMNVDRALALSKSERFFVQADGSKRGIFQCDICAAHYNHGEIWRYLPTGEHITLGMDCAEKYSMYGDRSEWLAWHKEQTRLRSLAAKERKFKKAAHEFLESNTELKTVFEALPEPTNAPAEGPDGFTRFAPEPRQIQILRDMLRKLNQYGSLSVAQVNFAMKLGAELKTKSETPTNVKAEERHVPAPEGRVTFRGTVVSAKTHETDFGPVEKLTVKMETPDGSWLVWVTDPRGLHVEDENGQRSVRRGDVVEMTATLTRSRDSQHFAFGKRPTKASVIQ